MDSHSNREVVEIYLIGAVILFTLSVAGTFLIAFFSSPIDLLIPIKALTMYTIMSFVVLNYVTYNYLDGVAGHLGLFLEIALELAVAAAFLPYLKDLFSQTRLYSLADYPSAFVVLPTLSLMFAIAGVFVVTYYSVDI